MLRVLAIRAAAAAAAPARRLPAAAARSLAASSTGDGAGAADEQKPKIEVRRPQPARAAESVEQLRSRLLYQSRKRGIRENDLLMGAFAHERLHGFDEAALREYDVILNDHDNEWDMYAWMVGKRELPDYLLRSSVMRDLVDFAKNRNKEMRVDLPPLRDAPEHKRQA